MVEFQRSHLQDGTLAGEEGIMREEEEKRDRPSVEGLDRTLGGDKQLEEGNDSPSKSGISARALTTWIEMDSSHHPTTMAASNQSILTIHRRASANRSRSPITSRGRPRASCSLSLSESDEEEEKSSEACRAPFFLRRCFLRRLVGGG